MVCRCRLCRGGGGRGGGGRGGGDGGSGKPQPAYSKKYSDADGGGARIDHKNVAYNEEWHHTHQRAWTRSKMYDDNRTQWRADHAKYKAWVAGGNKGFLRDFDGTVKQELTGAQKKVALQAQIDALG